MPSEAIPVSEHHPLAAVPCYIANLICQNDGVYTALNLIRIFDDACLALLELMKPSTNATTYNGSIGLLAG